MRLIMIMAEKTGLERQIHEIAVWLLVLMIIAWVGFQSFVRPNFPFSWPRIENRLESTVWIVATINAIFLANMLFPIIWRAAAFALDTIKKRMQDAYTAYAFAPRITPVVLIFVEFFNGHRKQFVAVTSRLTPFALIFLSFTKGQRQYYVTIGALLFLLLSPLVILNASDLAKPTVVLFVFLAAVSFKFGLEERIVYVTAFLFLLLCPVLLITKDQPRAELSATYAYYSFATGAALQFADYIIKRRKYQEAFES